MYSFSFHLYVDSTYVSKVLYNNIKSCARLHINIVKAKIRARTETCNIILGHGHNHIHRKLKSQSLGTSTLIKLLAGTFSVLQNLSNEDINNRRVLDTLF